MGEISPITAATPESTAAPVLQARRWAAELVHWYNHEHRHSAIGFVTPDQRHTKVDISLLQGRDKVYAAARSANPNRWSGPTRDWSHINQVHLNPESSDKHNHSHQKLLEHQTFCDNCLDNYRGVRTCKWHSC